MGGYNALYISKTARNNFGKSYSCLCWAKNGKKKHKNRRDFNTFNNLNSHLFRSNRLLFRTILLTQQYPLSQRFKHTWVFNTSIRNCSIFFSENETILWSLGFQMWGNIDNMRKILWRWFLFPFFGNNTTPNMAIHTEHVTLVIGRFGENHFL